MPKKRISGTTASLMLVVAIIIDVIGAAMNAVFGFGSTATNVVGYAIFTLWFSIHKVAIWKGKERNSVILTGLIELIPFLNILPALTRMVWKVIHLTNIEDAKKHKASTNETQNSGNEYGTIVRAKRVSEQEQIRRANQ